METQSPWLSSIAPQTREVWCQVSCNKGILSVTYLLHVPIWELVEPPIAGRQCSGLPLAYPLLSVSPESVSLNQSNSWKLRKQERKMLLPPSSCVRPDICWGWSGRCVFTVLFWWHGSTFTGMSDHYFFVKLETFTNYQTVTLRKIHTPHSCVKPRVSTMQLHQELLSGWKLELALEAVSLVTRPNSLAVVVQWSSPL